MIEITTGVVFLMSSLYGAGQHGYKEKNIQSESAGSARAEKSEKMDESTFTDREALTAYLRKEYAETPILVEIARCESTFRHYGENGKIIRGRVNSHDIGVMQINLLYHADTAEGLNIDLYTVEGNVEYAKYLYGKYGSKPWSASEPCWSSGELARK